MAYAQRTISRDDDEKLDFNVAMRDFCTMFPTLDESIIESVLRANNGAVDDTIDQLLLITTDLDGYKETLPKRLDQPSSSNVNLPSGDLLNLFSGSTNAEDLLTDFLSLPPTPRIPVSPVPSIRSITLPVQQHKKKTYHPPLLGKLPADFLRLDGINLAAERKHSYTDPPPPYSAAVVKRAHSVCSQPRTTPHQTMNRAHLGIFSTSVPSTSSGSSTRRSHKQMDTQLQKQAETLKDKMAENQWRRQVTHDPDLEQFLEDERIALMLQNQEFLWQLQNDRDFLTALERDAAKQKRNVKIEKKSSKHGRGSTNETMSPRFTVIDSPSREETVMEGYSDLPVDPFPYTKPLPKSDDIEMAFGDKLKLMGKSSKRKFALMARRFVRKKKGAKGILGASESHYSGMSLLEATDDPEDMHGLLQSDSGYNQPDDDDNYNISNKSDLKEGRLFPA